MSALKDIINSGNANMLGGAFKQGQVGEVLNAGGVRLQRETVAVASATATPTYTILHLLHCKTATVGAAGEKAPGVNGATPSTGQAAPNAAGTSIVFNAETTGTGTADVVYLTADPPKDADGIAATALSASGNGLG